MDIKEIVFKIETLNGVTCSIIHDSLTIKNHYNGLLCDVQLSEVKSINSIVGPNNEDALQISYANGSGLILSEQEFVFEVIQDEKYFVKECPPMCSTSEMLNELADLIYLHSKLTNSDELVGKYFLSYYCLKGALNAGLKVNNQLTKLYSVKVKHSELSSFNQVLFNGIYTGNSGLNLPILKVTTAYGLHDFINNWSSQYAYSNESMYEVINNPTLNYDELLGLYIWKNGTALSTLKQVSFDTNIGNKLSLINELKSSNTFDLKDFKHNFGHVSAVWQIFLLHVIKPKIYPIYDQHIHRAYLFFHHLDYSNLDNTMKDNLKLEFYFDTYLPFVQEHNFKDLKKMDEAFFAFGKFLKTGKQSKLVSEHNQ
jgi:hypothetical protein